MSKLWKHLLQLTYQKYQPNMKFLKRSDCIFSKWLSQQPAMTPSFEPNTYQFSETLELVNCLSLLSSGPNRVGNYFCVHVQNKLRPWHSDQISKGTISSKPQPYKGLKTERRKGAKNHGNTQIWTLLGTPQLEQITSMLYMRWEGGGKKF